ncbi:hypothetical protein [Streptomyces sp. NBC_00448]|uniref:hypothetical protein n=1 Tax=Streptomyces sp. NBC_00448 TaxID=2903652 RepID=UPI002E1F89BB
MTTAAVVMGAMVTTVLSRPAVADSITANQGVATVAQYQGVWNAPPSHLTGGDTVDAPLMGNGDVGVAVGGGIDNQTFYVGKNDFWSSTSHAIKPLGRIVVSAGGLAGASYHVVQDIQHAEVRGTYTLGGQTLATRSWVDADTNLFVTSFTLTGGSAQSIGVTLQNVRAARPPSPPATTTSTPTWSPTPAAAATRAPGWRCAPSGRASRYPAAS